MNTSLQSRLPDLLGAGITLALGIWVIAASADYDMGTLREMGPGYFPRLVGSGLILLGGLLAVLTLKKPGTQFGTDRPALSSVLLISASLISFAVLIERNGLFPALFVAVLLSTFASDNRNVVRSLFLSAITAGVSCVVFIYALGLSMKVFQL